MYRVSWSLHIYISVDQMVIECFPQSQRVYHTDLIQGQAGHIFKTDN